jgi:hypothetical protein
MRGLQLLAVMGMAGCVGHDDDVCFVLGGGWRALWWWCVHGACGGGVCLCLITAHCLG